MGSRFMVGQRLYSGARRYIGTVTHMVVGVAVYTDTGYRITADDKSVTVGRRNK